MVEQLASVVENIKKKLTHTFDINKHVDPIVSYINRDRSREYIDTDVPVAIPVSKNERVVYKKADYDWTTNRDLHFYNEVLFSDEYQYYKVDELYHSSKMKSDAKPILGGRDRAFAPGNVVLELGSGEAVALLQFSRLYPDTTFIGVDFGYVPTMHLDLKRKGVQLLHENWDTLQSLPDQSIDTFLSVQGGFSWGTDPKPDRSIPILDAVSRVAKHGATLRTDDIDYWSYDPYISNYLRKLGWTIRVDGAVVCVKS